jgi:hypothetical protein
VASSYVEEFEESVRDYWRVRADQRRLQEERGVVDIGSRSEATGGKQMESLTKLVAQVFLDEGLPKESVGFQKAALNVPGYYRRAKEWDLVVVHKGILVAAVELKSIASAYGNNLNNRVEEALGNAEDIRTAYRKELLGSTHPWLGYLFMIADEEESRRPPKREVRPVLPTDPLFKGASYQQRAEIFCRRLVREQLYDDVCFVVSTKSTEATVLQPAEDMTFNRFVASIKGRARYILALVEEA